MQAFSATCRLIFIALAVSTGAAHRLLLQVPAPAPAPGECSTVAQQAQDANLTTLLAAATRAGLAATLADPTLRYTVFAPTNDAFVKTNLTEEELLASPDLEAILNNHLLAYPLTVFDLLAAREVLTQNNRSELSITSENIANEDVTSVETDEVTARIVVPDVRACESIVHVVDEVLLP